MLKLSIMPNENKSFAFQQHIPHVCRAARRAHWTRRAARALDAQYAAPRGASNARAARRVQCARRAARHTCGICCWNANDLSCFAIINNSHVTLMFIDYVKIFLYKYYLYLNLITRRAVR